MKATELIAALEREVAIFGDVDVTIAGFDDTMISCDHSLNDELDGIHVDRVETPNTFTKRQIRIYPEHLVRTVVQAGEVPDVWTDQTYREIMAASAVEPKPRGKHEHGSL